MGAGALKATFSLLGVTAAFQSVFGENVDKSDEGLARAFGSVDVDGSGKISADEMKAYIASVYGDGLDGDTVGSMMRAADTDGDGEVDLEEFKMIMRAGPQQRAQDEHARQPDGGETSDDASRAKLVSDTEPDEPPPVAVREQVPAPAPAPAASEGEAVAASDVKIWM